MAARATPVYGIDTSVFVRLLTGHPQADFDATVSAIQKLLEFNPGAELVVSNQVIGEAYITLQFHYGISKSDAKQGIRTLLSEGVISPLNGSSILEILKNNTGAGLVDRLIVQDYQQKGLITLTNDKAMAKIPGAKAL